MESSWLELAANIINLGQYHGKGTTHDMYPSLANEKGGLKYVKAIGAGGRLIRACSFCFIFDKMVVEGRYELDNMAKRSCCKGHREHHKKFDTFKLQKAREPRPEIIDLPIRPPCIPEKNHLKIREIIDGSLFLSCRLFYEENLGETILNHDGFPVHKYPSGNELMICSACLCYESALASGQRNGNSATSQHLCRKHNIAAEKEGNVWPSQPESTAKREKEKLLTRKSANIPLNRFHVRWGDPENCKNLYTRGHLFRYFMKKTRYKKVVNRLLNIKNLPRLGVRVPSTAVPYISIAGELKIWEGGRALSVCEACYSKRNMLRRCPGMSRLCVAHLS